MSSFLTAAAVLDAIPVDDLPFDNRPFNDSIFAALEELEVPITLEDGQMTVNPWPIVKGALLLLRDAVDYCAETTGRSRAEILFDLRMLAASDDGSAPEAGIL